METVSYTPLDVYKRQLLGDILSAIADENTSEQMKKLTRGNESEEYIQMLFASAERPEGRNYLQDVSEKCREYLVRIVPAREAVKSLVALGYRDKLWDLVPDAGEKNLLEVRHGKGVEGISGLHRYCELHFHRQARLHVAGKIQL